MEPVEHINRPLRKMIVNNFLGGIAWGFGATIGLSIVLAILTLILKQINLVPIVGGFLTDVLRFMANNNTLIIPQ